jgi:hypothetical protein
VAYALGGSVAESSGGIRHGLDLAVMPFFFRAKSTDPEPEHKKPQYDYVLGASGLLGFGKTPSYIGLDFGVGEDGGSLFPMGIYKGFGPALRFPKDGMPTGFGGQGRFSCDILFVQVGLRFMLLWGRESSEFVTLVSLGVGRF